MISILELSNEKEVKVKVDGLFTYYCLDMTHMSFLGTTGYAKYIWKKHHIYCNS